MANSWYAYDGIGNPFSTTSYQRITITPACLDGGAACTIYLLYDTNPTPTNPFSDNIIAYIGNGIATLVRQPLGLGIKPFFYLKN